MQSFKFLRYALHGDLVEDRRERGGGENNAYFNGHFAVCTATLGPKVSPNDKYVVRLLLMLCQGKFRDKYINVCYIGLGDNENISISSKRQNTLQP